MNSVKKKKKEDLQHDPKSDNPHIPAAEEKGHCGVSKRHTSSLDDDYRSLPSPSRSVLRSSYTSPRSKELRVTFQHNSSDESLKKYITPQSPGRALDSQNFTDACWPALKPFVTSVTWPLPQESTELESHTNRLLRLSSDLYVVTHLPDVAIPMQSFSEDSPEQRSPCCTLSMESLLQSCKHKLQKTMSTQTDTWRLNERHTRGLKTKEQTLLPEGMRPSLLGQVFHPDGPDLCTVLRALLDLVDQHWSGPLSLHLSPSFMAKAIRLLMPLSTTVPPLQNDIRSLEEENKDTEGDKQEKREHRSELTGGEESRGWGECGLDFDVSEAGHLRRQLAKSQNEVESLKKRLTSSLKENYMLRSDKKATACLKSEAVPLDLTEHLEKESKVLQEQEKLLKQLEETVHALHSNQRSLVSHNNLLLNMIKRKASTVKETV